MMVHFQIGNSATTKTEVSETRIIVNFFPKKVFFSFFLFALIINHD